jgi:hypothetical protein
LGRPAPRPETDRRWSHAAAPDDRADWVRSDFSDNKLTAVPESVCFLSNLKHL